MMKSLDLTDMIESWPLPDIEGPGLGEARKSYSKFRNLDIGNQFHYGIDPDVKADEAFVNKFDIKHQRLLSERGRRQKRAQGTGIN